jgi:membrane protein implicated in regulation of membrane protease activity
MAFLVALGLALFVLSYPWNWVAVTLGAAVELGETYFWWWLSHRRRPAVGVETLVGVSGTVTAPCRPEGQVRVRGELWQGRCEEGADPGDAVEVIAVDRLTLVVARR